jgi:ankyrin repeat protein
MATNKGHEETVRLLLELGANVHAQAKRGETPLHHAVCVEIVKLLLVLGANVDARDESGGTPLHMAAHMGHEEK